MRVSKRDDDDDFNDDDSDEKKKSDEIVPNLLDVHPDGRRETHKPDVRVLFFRSKRWWLPVRGNRTKMAKELARKQNLPNAFVKLWLGPIETEILRVGYVSRTHLELGYTLDTRKGTRPRILWRDING